MSQASRDKILQALGGTRQADAVSSSAPSPPHPDYAFETKDRIALFCTHAEKQQAQTLRTDTAMEALGIVARHYQKDAPAEQQEKDIPIHITRESPLFQLPWQQAGFAPHAYKKQLGMSYGASLASAGIAESGTLIIPAGKDSARGANFLIDDQIVFVSAENIFLLFEDYWAQAKTQVSAINLITGPSRTADIEQELLLGAHGPKSLHIIIYQRLG